jgi:hypothetical protein
MTSWQRRLTQQRQQQQCVQQPACRALLGLAARVVMMAKLVACLAAGMVAAVAATPVWLRSWAWGWGRLVPAWQALWQVLRWLPSRR